MTKPLYSVPAKPRGLESISISPKELIGLLKEEKTRQAKRLSKAKREHRQKVIDILADALKEARTGKIIGRSRYREEWILDLPKPPVFSPCDYDETIHRLSHDKREELVLSSTEWARFFPCDLNGDGDSD